MENKNHLRVSIDPMKMKCGILLIKSPKTGVSKKCLVLPIEDNDIYNKVDESGKIIVRLTFDVWENNQVSQYGDTHMVKQSHSREWNDAHTDEDRKAEPILGNARPIELKTIEHVNVPTAEVESDPNDDLPF